MRMFDIKSLRNNLEQQKGRKAQIEQDIITTTINLKEQKRVLRRHEQAREVIRTVALKTQQQLQYHISEITTLALESIFEDPYKLEAEFIERRNKTECDLYFTRDGNPVDPLDSGGIGAADVAAFSLRCASWSMQTPRSRNTLILDEPFKHLKGRKDNLKVLDLTKEISERMGLQLIIVSDERVDREDIEDRADKIFDVRMKNKVSYVT